MAFPDPSRNQEILLNPTGHRSQEFTRGHFRDGSSAPAVNLVQADLGERPVSDP